MAKPKVRARSKTRVKTVMSPVSEDSIILKKLFFQWAIFWALGESVLLFIGFGIPLFEPLPPASFWSSVLISVVWGTITFLVIVFPTLAEQKNWVWAKKMMQGCADY